MENLVKVVKAVSTGSIPSETINGKTMYDGYVAGTLTWACPYCHKAYSHGDHVRSWAFFSHCECGKDFQVRW